MRESERGGREGEEREGVRGEVERGREGEGEREGIPETFDFFRNDSTRRAEMELLVLSKRADLPTSSVTMIHL